MLRPNRESVEQRAQRRAAQVEYRKELQAVATMRPRKRSQCMPVRLALVSHRDVDDPVRIAAPCPFISCPHHLHVDVGRIDGSITFMPGEIERTCALDVVDANPDGLTREEIAIACGYSDERSRIVERALERRLREACDRDDFEDSADAGESPLAQAGIR